MSDSGDDISKSSSENVSLSGASSIKSDLGGVVDENAAGNTADNDDQQTTTTTTNLLPSRSLSSLKKVDSLPSIAMNQAFITIKMIKTNLYCFLIFISLNKEITTPTRPRMLQAFRSEASSSTSLSSSTSGGGGSTRNFMTIVDEPPVPPPIVAPTTTSASTSSSAKKAIHTQTDWSWMHDMQMIEKIRRGMYLIHKVSLIKRFIK